MASLALGIVGSYIGGAAISGTVMGMTGAAIGWAVGSFVGSLIDQRLFGPTPPTLEGPRLDDLNVQSSAYGAHIPRVYGAYRMAGNIIWSAGIKETRHE